MVVVPVVPLPLLHESVVVVPVVPVVVVPVVPVVVVPVVPVVVVQVTSTPSTVLQPLYLYISIFR